MAVSIENDEKTADGVADKTPNKSKENGGKENMENSNYGRTNIDDFLTVRGFGGYGYGGGGYGGGGYGGHGGILREDAHADGTGRGENIKSVKDSVHYGHEVIGDRLEEIQRTGQFHELFRVINENRNASERQNFDTNMKIADNAAQAAKCCCELGEKIGDVKSELIALNKDTVIEGLKADLLSAKFDAIDKDRHGR